MGFFGKDRHGTMEVVTPGSAFRWKLPNFTSYKNCVLDSHNVKAFTGAEFHFHMVIGEKGDIGMYLHYKAMPIPKYSYFFASPDGTKLRQHTAHTIPSDTERCGHWNVCSMEEVSSIMPADDDTLLVWFSFDDDELDVFGSTDLQVKWTIPRMVERNLEPFCSRGFLVNGMNFVIRSEHRPQTETREEECHFFIFNRRGSQIPPHTITCTSPDGTFLGASEPGANAGAQILRVPMEAIRNVCDTTRSKLLVTLLMNTSTNPLDFFNSASPERQTDTSRTVAPKVVDITGKGTKGSQYVVVNADDI